MRTRLSSGVATSSRWMLTQVDVPLVTTTRRLNDEPSRTEGSVRTARGVRVVVTPPGGQVASCAVGVRTRRLGSPLLMVTLRLPAPAPPTSRKLMASETTSPASTVPLLLPPASSTATDSSCR
ncbi:MAG: hypothetical protein R3D98_17360 [Candidatus Krumholzibacteriia bacterium]